MSADISDADRELRIRALQKAEHDFYLCAQPYMDKIAELHTLYDGIEQFSISPSGEVTMTRAKLPPPVQEQIETLNVIIAYIRELCFNNFNRFNHVPPSPHHAPTDRGPQDLPERLGQGQDSL